ncbi:MAG: polysaccharide biosynthesis tyrosine autokinase, partial [Candidatus Latescibacteria bacterium]|nr:polysaccharide biosynthesis tyrosine autokinase [Candidatus Latescibacterota bacterium]
MAQYEMNLRDYQRVLRKRWKIIFASATLVASCSWVIAKQEVPIYQAKAYIQIEEVGTMSDLLVQSMVTYSVWDNIATQTMVVRSLPVMKGVVYRLGRPESEAEELLKVVTAEQAGSTNVIEVGATSKDPEDAQKIANMTADVYDAYSDSLRKKAIKETKAFIESQLDSCQQRLQKAEDSLEVFQRLHEIPTMDAETNYSLSKLAGLESDIGRVGAEIAQLTLQVADLKKDGRLIDYRIGAVSAKGESQTAGADGGEQDPYAGASSALAAQLMALRFQRTDLLRVYTEVHPEIKVLDEKIRKVQEAIRVETESRLKVLQGQRDTLYSAYRNQKIRVMTLPVLQLQYTRLLRDIDVNASLFKTLQEKHYEAMIKEADTKDEVQVINRAKKPKHPINRDVSGKVGAGLAIGVILGLVVAFIKESLDTSLGTMEDMEEYLGVPVLAMIPHIEMKEQVTKVLAINPSLADYPNPEKQAQLITQLDSKSGVAEGYRILRTHLQYASSDRECKMILMTSARSGEGKTMTVSNLAIVLAQAAKRTLLVECDLRRPGVYSAFGIDREPGVIGIVLGEIDWHDCIKGVTDLMMGRLGMEGVMAQPGLDHLHIITCGGPAPPQPAEMLATERMRRFLEEAREEYDHVLLDMPPVLPVTDATVLSRLVDGILLTYQAGQRRADLKLAKIRLDGMTKAHHGKSEAAGAEKSKVIGVILNDVRAETVGYSISPSRYYYYYAETEENGRFASLI